MRQSRMPFLIDRSKRQQPTSLAELASLTRQAPIPLAPINLPDFPGENPAYANAKIDADESKATAEAYKNIYMQQQQEESATQGPQQGEQKSRYEIERQRQKDMAKRMITSGDKGLQAQGFSALSKLNDEDRETPDSSGPESPEGKIAFDEGFTPGTPAFNKRVTALKESGEYSSDMKDYLYAKDAEGFTGGYMDYKAAIKTKMFESDKDKAVTGDDLKNYLVPDKGGNWVTPKPGITNGELYAAGAKLKEEFSPEIAGKYAMLEVAQKGYHTILDTIYKPDGSINQMVLKGATMIDKASNLPIIGDFAATAAKAHFGEFSSKLNQALEAGMQAITRTETGAAMASEEISNTKQRFMPKYGEPDALIDQKLKAYKRFLDTAMSMIRDRTNSTKPGELTKQEILDLADKELAKVQGSSKGKSDNLAPNGEPWDEE